MKRLVTLALVVATLTCSSLLAQSKPFQASLTPDIAIHDSTTLIEGLTLSVWGENPQRSLAIGIANGMTGDSSGFSFGFLLNYADDYTGVMWACVNYTEGDVLGWQDGFVNYCGGSLTGVQSGWVNYAQRLKGLQFGLFNFVEQVDETIVQIGLLNVIRPNEEWFANFPDQVAPAMIFVNWRF